MKGSETAGPSRSRKLALAAAVVLFFVLVLEGGARVLGLGDPEAFGGSRLWYQQVFPPLLKATDDGYRPRDPRLADRRVPRDGTRVFVFGESAVAGLGMSENGSFPRALERRLRARSQNTTVVNLGIVALSARQVACVERDVARLRKAEGAAAKDVFVFHVGNNEFLELHAERFIAAKGGLPPAQRLDRALEASRLYLSLKQLSLAARSRRLNARSFAGEDQRVAESDLVQTAELTDDEVKRVVDGYGERVRGLVALAREAGALPVLMTVATNLLWGGREDPPIPQGPDARRALDERIAAKKGNGLERWRDLFQRAHVRLAQGDVAGAREDFVLAKDQDPRLRRCLSAMNDQVRRIAKELEVPLVDGEAELARACEHGIAGFPVLYDYVHFTPRGAELLAQALDDALVAAKVVAPWPEGKDHAARRLAALEAAPHDTLEVTEWLGWNEDRSFLASRDLWKFESARKALDQRAAEGKASARELVFAANGYALEVGSEARARELYEKAKALDPALAPVVDANLRWLSVR
jgi:lysophospholipase L1-like esterase